MGSKAKTNVGGNIDIERFYKHASHFINSPIDKRKYPGKNNHINPHKEELFDGKMDLKAFIKDLAAELDLPKEYVYRVYVSVFESLEHVWASYPNPIPIEDELFENLPFHNFEIPFLGMIMMDHVRYKKKKVRKIARNTDDDKLKDELKKFNKGLYDTVEVKDRIYSEVQAKRAKGDIIDMDAYMDMVKNIRPYSYEDYNDKLTEIIKENMEFLPEFNKKDKQ